MEKLLILVTFAFVVEHITEIVKKIKEDGKLNPNVLLSIVVGILVAFTIKLDIFVLLGQEAYIPYVGVILAGLTISGGANLTYDLIEKVLGDKPKSEEEGV